MEVVCCYTVSFIAILCKFHRFFGPKGSSDIFSMHVSSEHVYLLQKKCKIKMPVPFGRPNYYKQHSDVQNIVCTSFQRMTQIITIGYQQLLLNNNVFS